MSRKRTSKEVAKYYTVLVLSLSISLSHTCTQAHVHTPTIFKFEDRNGSSKLPHHHTISRIQTNGQEMNSLINWIPKNAKQMVKIVTFEETFGECLLNLPHRLKKYKFGMNFCFFPWR